MSQGILECRGRQGTFVASQGPKPLNTYEQLVKSHLAVVMPEWTAPEWENQFGIELRHELLCGAHARGWSITFYQEPGQLTDPQFPSRWRAAGCTALLMLNPAETAAVPLTNLRAAGVPIVSIGRGPAAFGLLGIPVIDGDDESAMYRLVSRLMVDGCERITVAGNLDTRLGTMRQNGCRRALEQSHQTMPDDMFIESFDRGHVIAALARRLDAPSPPQAVVFQEFPSFLQAIRVISQLAPRIRHGLRVAVFDTCYLHRCFPDLPLIEVSLDPTELAARSMTLTERLVAGETAPPETLLSYQIGWPKNTRK